MRFISIPLIKPHASGSAFMDCQSVSRLSTSTPSSAVSSRISTKTVSARLEVLAAYQQMYVLVFAANKSIIGS